jgi:hypothetical protein
MKLGTNHPKMKRSKNCSKEGPGSFPRGDNYINAKTGWDHLRILFSRTTEREELIFAGKLSEHYIVDSSLYKSWYQGVGRGHNRVKHILHRSFSMEKIFSPRPQKVTKNFTN